MTFPEYALMLSTIIGPESILLRLDLTYALKI